MKFLHEAIRNLMATMHLMENTFWRWRRVSKDRELGRLNIQGVLGTSAAG